MEGPTRTADCRNRHPSRRRTDGVEIVCELYARLCTNAQITGGENRRPRFVTRTPTGRPTKLVGRPDECPNRVRGLATGRLTLRPTWWTPGRRTYHGGRCSLDLPDVSTAATDGFDDHAASRPKSSTSDDETVDKPKQPPPGKYDGDRSKPGDGGGSDQIEGSHDHVGSPGDARNLTVTGPENLDSDVIAPGRVHRQGPLTTAATRPTSMTTKTWFRWSSKATQDVRVTGLADTTGKVMLERRTWRRPRSRLQAR